MVRPKVLFVFGVAVMFGFAKSLFRAMREAIAIYDARKMNYSEIIPRIDIRTNADNIERLFLPN
jgi:hypothetical protein